MGSARFTGPTGSRMRTAFEKVAQFQHSVYIVEVREIENQIGVSPMRGFSVAPPFEWRD
jgi:hypothetical protein